MARLDAELLRRAHISEERYQRALPYERRRDDFVFATFPGFVVIFALVCIVWFIHEGIYTVSEFIFTLCSTYTLGFSLYGIPCMFLTRVNVVRGVFVGAFVVVGSLVLGALMWTIFGEDYLGVNYFVTEFWNVLFSAFDEVSLEAVLEGVFLVVLCVTVSTYGILSVTVAYFRKHYPKILLSMMKPGTSKLKRGALRFFGVPDIIDVTDVTLEPEPSDGRLDSGVMYEVAGWEILVGLTISSYLFLNPVFLGSMPFLEMMGSVLMISLFEIVLIAAGSILKRLHAEAHSAAPRPYVLWKGMKNRLFQGYFLLAVFVTLLWVSAYTDQDLARIASQYMGYFVAMVLISLLVSFIYVNSFYTPFKRSIEDSYTALKEEYLGGSEEEEEEEDGYERSNLRGDLQGQEAGAEREPDRRRQHPGGLPDGRPPQPEGEDGAGEDLRLLPRRPRPGDLPAGHRPGPRPGLHRGSQGVRGAQVDGAQEGR